MNVNALNSYCRVNVNIRLCQQLWFDFMKTLRSVNVLFDIWDFEQIKYWLTSCMLLHSETWSPINNDNSGRRWWITHIQCFYRKWNIWHAAFSHHFFLSIFKQVFPLLDSHPLEFLAYNPLHAAALNSSSLASGHRDELHLLTIWSLLT